MKVGATLTASSICQRHIGNIIIPIPTFFIPNIKVRNFVIIILFWWVTFCWVKLGQVMIKQDLSYLEQKPDSNKCESSLWFTFTVVTQLFWFLCALSGWDSVLWGLKNPWPILQDWAHVLMPAKISIISPFMHFVVLQLFTCPPQVAYFIVGLIMMYNWYIFLKHVRITLERKMSYKSEIILMLHFYSKKRNQNLLHKY